MRKYTTVTGDMWDSIAKKLLGSEKNMIDLLKANPAHRETVVFSAGVVLSIPDVEAVEAPAVLPPWRRS